MVQMLVSTYEKIIFPKSIPYWIFWPLIGVIWFILGEVAILGFADRQYFWTQLIFSGGAGLLPTLYISMSRNYQTIMKDLSTLLWNNEKDFDRWLQTRFTQIFTLRTWYAKFVTFFIVIAALVNVILLGLPFQSQFVNILVVLEFTSLLVICGQGAYILMAFLFSLKEITERSPKTPFFRFLHPAISNLQNYCSSSALYVTIAYISLVIAVWQGPYGLTIDFQIWLTVLAFYPVSMFIWSFVQIHSLMAKIKQYNIDIINKEIQNILDKTLSSQKVEDIERLEKMMGIQEKVQSSKEGTFDLQGTVTFLIALATAITQVVISIWQIVKP